MNVNDKPNFVRLLNGLAALKPGARLTPEALDLWWAAMSPTWSMKDFRDAAAHLATQLEFFPSPFHFDQLRRAGRLKPGEAWDLARKACGSAIQCGYVTHNGTSGNELIDAAVRAIGGYGAIAQCEVSKLPFLERRFCEHYAAISDAHDVRVALPELIADTPPYRLSGERGNVRRLR